MKILKIFNDKNYTDKKFHKDYPTHYHLREAMKTQKNPDIRKVYLALHHIYKSRGHHLFKEQSFSNGTIEATLNKLLTTLHIDLDIKKVTKICLSKDNTTNKVKAFKEITNDKQTQEIFRLIFGGSVSLDKIYNMDEYKELDSNVKTISFKNKNYDEIRHEYETVLNDNIELLDKIKLVYDVKKDSLKATYAYENFWSEDLLM